MLDVLQNTHDVHFQFGAETLDLLRAEFDIPLLWQQAIADVGETQFDPASLATLLDDWFCEKLSPVRPRHAELLDSFVERYWDFYQSLHKYRAGPSDERAAALRLDFDALFATHTGYAALDVRIAKTAAKRGRVANGVVVTWSSVAQQRVGVASAGERASSGRELTQSQRGWRTFDGHLHDAGADRKEAGPQRLRLSPRPAQPPLHTPLACPVHPGRDRSFDNCGR